MGKMVMLVQGVAHDSASAGERDRRRKRERVRAHTASSQLQQEASRAASERASEAKQRGSEWSGRGRRRDGTRVRTYKSGKGVQSSPVGCCTAGGGGPRGSIKERVIWRGRADAGAVVALEVGGDRFVLRLRSLLSTLSSSWSSSGAWKR